MPKPATLLANRPPGLESRILMMLLGAGLMWLALGQPLERPKPTPVPPNPVGPVVPDPNPRPRPDGPVVPASDAFRAGRTYRGQVLTSYAAALDAAAARIAGGGDLAAVLADVGTGWTAARKAAFDASVSPTLERLAPAGTVPDRAVLSGAFADLARAMREP